MQAAEEEKEKGKRRQIEALLSHSHGACEAEGLYVVLSPWHPLSYCSSQKLLQPSIDLADQSQEPHRCLDGTWRKLRDASESWEPEGCSWFASWGGEVESDWEDTHEQHVHTGFQEMVKTKCRGSFSAVASKGSISCLSTPATWLNLKAGLY